MTSPTSSAPIPLPDAYDADGTAAYLQKSRRTIDRWTADGLLTHYKIGGRRYYRKADLDSFVASSRSDAKG